jgi:exodeoxyribonuclease V alpha subunit
MGGPFLMPTLEKLLAGTPKRHWLRERLVRIHGTEHVAALAIQSDPYGIILDVSGAGWVSADAVGRACGVPPDDPRRMTAAIEEIMRQQETWGHCWHAPSGLLAELVRMANVPSSAGAAAIQRAVDRGHVVAEDEDHLYFPRLHRDEVLLADAILRLQGDGAAGGLRGAWFPYNDIDGLHQDQADAFMLAKSASMSIVTGPPGSGKTYMLRALLDHFSGSVELVAPTGRAAKRMQESAGRPASTIHRALKPNHSGAGWSFTRASVGPDLLVVDEASMLSLSLASQLFRRVQSGTRVLLIGDANQLPAVGPGDVLRDIIRSDAVPVAKLTTIKRQDDAILVRACSQVISGQMPDLPAPGESDLAYIETTSGERVGEIARGLLAHRQMREKHGAEDDIAGIQAITPRRRKGSPTSCVEFNRALWNQRHPEHADAPFPSMLPGDKVMQTKNDYELGAMNGDLGEVVKVAGGDISVRMDGEIVTGRKSQWSLDHAWATTIHKGQGSQWPVTILMMHESAGSFLLSRQLLYTAMSRAEKLCIVVGSRSSIASAIRNNREEKRRTGLEVRLK